jgi:hypothetical protein
MNLGLAALKQKGLEFAKGPVFDRGCWSRIYEAFGALPKNPCQSSSKLPWATGRSGPADRFVVRILRHKEQRFGSKRKKRTRHFEEQSGSLS